MSAHFGVTSDFAGPRPHVFGPKILERVLAAKNEVSYIVGSLTPKRVVAYVSEVAKADRTVLPQTERRSLDSYSDAELDALYAPTEAEDRALAAMGLSAWAKRLK